MVALSSDVMPHGESQAGQANRGKSMWLLITGAYVQSFGHAGHSSGPRGRLLLNGAYPELCPLALLAPAGQICQAPRCQHPLGAAPAPLPGRGTWSCWGPNLQAERGVILLEEEVPDVQGSI